MKKNWRDRLPLSEQEREQRKRIAQMTDAEREADSLLDTEPVWTFATVIKSDGRELSYKEV